jgi:hypothetical protein
MKLKHLIASAAFAFASVGASAATLTSTLTSPGGNFYSGSFGNTVNFSGAFTDTISFLPSNLGGNANGLIGTIAFDAIQNIDFSSVTLNGIPFFLTVLGPAEAGVLFPVNVNAPLILTVVGLSGGNGSYAGTLNLRARVPEPGILALLGIAGLGFALSRRRKETTPSGHDLASA